MKKILLMFSLVLSCYAPMLAQSITGEANPCPSTPNIYRLIIPSVYGTPWVYFMNLAMVGKGNGLAILINLIGWYLNLIMNQYRPTSMVSTFGWRS